MINLTNLDWAMLAVLVLSVLLGVWRGLVHEVLAIVGWVAAFVLAHLFADEVGQMINIQGVRGQFRYILGFGVVFIGTLIASGLLTWLVKKMLQRVGLTQLDRTLGGAFGAVRALMILLALTTVVLMTPLQETAAWRESVGASKLTVLLKIAQPWLPSTLTKYIQTAGVNHPGLGPQLCVES